MARAPLSFPTRRSSDLIFDGGGVEVKDDLPLVIDMLLRGFHSRSAGVHQYVGRALVIDYPFVERSEEHTSELQSRGHLVCRLLLVDKQTAGVRGVYSIH